MLILVRGLPGAGKTTFAKKFDGAQVFAADDFFYRRGGGVYDFDGKLLGEAHAECQKNARGALEAGEVVVVANTFSCRWEMEPYLKAAQENGVRVIVADLFDGGLTDEALVERNLHNVPLSVIVAMRERWEHEWRDGDTRAPWER